MDDLVDLALLGSFLGWLYPLVVGAFLGAAVLVARSFRPRPAQWLSLLAPAAVYYTLDYLIAERQGFNVPYAVAPLTLLMAIAVLVSAVLGKPRLLVAGSCVGVVAAIGLWISIPHQGLDRLF
jgi:hypothetical protein